MPNNRHRAIARARRQRHQRNLRRNALMVSTDHGGRWDAKTDLIGDMKALRAQTKKASSVKTIMHSSRHALDPYTYMMAPYGLSLEVKPVNKIRMPRKLKKKIQKSFEALEAVYRSLPMGNMQIEKAYLQKHGGLPLRTCHQKAFNDLMLTGESFRLINIPRRLSPAQDAMESEGNQCQPYLKDAGDAIKNLELTESALKFGRSHVCIMSTPTISNMELEAARLAMRACETRHITIKPISEHFAVPQDIADLPNGLKPVHDYDELIKEVMKEISWSGRKIIRDEVDKDNDKG